MQRKLNDPCIKGKQQLFITKAKNKQSQIELRQEEEKATDHPPLKKDKRKKNALIERNLYIQNLNKIKE